MSDLNHDRLITHGVLNYLSASFQGKFAALNFLSSVKHPAFNQNQVDRAQHAITKVSTWLEQLYRDQCLLSADWSQPETFESKSALDLLESLRPELREIVQKSKRILELNEIPNREDLGLLLSFITRSIYARDVYVRGFVDFGKNLNFPEMVASYEALLPGINQERSNLEQLLSRFRDTAIPVSDSADFMLATHSMGSRLPVSYRTQLHDIVQLLAPFKGGLTFGLAEFDGRESSEWSSFNFGPVPAGYWRAYGFSPEDARAWVDARVVDPAFAAEWAAFGFPAAQASAWIEARFSADYARLWASAGYAPDQAIRAIERGIREPGGTPNQER